MQPTEKLKDFLYQEAEVCESCGNVYKVLQIKEGDDFNDFGMRHCPYCGMLTQEGF